MAKIVLDLGLLDQKLGTILDRVDRAAGSALELGLTAIANQAKALAPAGSSGVLRNSIRAGQVGGALSRGNMTGEVIADAPYAEAQESGSGLFGPKKAKYPIRPKNKKALRWAMQGFIGPVAPSIQGRAGAAIKSSSGFAFSKGVMHPGVKPQRFLERAVEAKIGVVERQMAAAIEGAIEGE